ncbi:FimD/PapC N-terminal domain-containing protein [Escherichia coli]
MLLTTLGVKTDNLNTEDNCILLDEAVHGGQYQWDISEHRLNLTVPQAYINELEEATFPQKVGIAALMLFTSHNLSQYRSYDSNNNSHTASYGRFNSGLNLFSWQLHSDASYSKPDDMKGKWQRKHLLPGTWLVADIKHSSEAENYPHSYSTLCDLAEYAYFAICKCYLILCKALHL